MERLWSFVDLMQLRGDKNYANDILDSDVYFKKSQQCAYMETINKL